MGAFSDLQAAIDDVAAQKAGLDGEYAEQRASIESQYELSETPEERAALDRLLARLDQERAEATEMLSAGYDFARQNVLQRQQEATGAGRAELEQMASTFEQTYARIAGSEEAARERSRLQGIPIEQAGGMSAAERSAAVGQAGMAAASQARNAMTQEDLAWLADSVQLEGMAAQADAARTATRVGGALQGDHDRRVQQRVGQERLAQASAFQNLDARFDQRSDGLLGRHGDLVGQLEQMRQSQSQFDEQLAENRRQFDAQLAEQQAARRAAARAASGGGRSRSSGGGGSSRSGPTAAGLQVDEKELQDHLDYLATPYTRSGEVPNQTRAGSRFYPRKNIGIAENAGFGLRASGGSSGSGSNVRVR